MSNKLAKKSEGEEKTITVAMLGIAQYIIAITAIAIGVVVPLYLKNGYHGVGDCKYEAYELMIRIGFVSLIAVLILYVITGGRAALSEKSVSTDAFIAAFALSAIISAFAGGNFKECIRGYVGWYMGLLSIISFGLLYFFLANLGRYYKVILWMILIVAFVTFVLGIINRLLIDPLGVYASIEDKYKNMFLSTLGQATWYSSYMSVTLPVGVGAFLSYDRKETPVRYYLSMIFVIAGFMTAVSQNSDSAYFALTGMFMTFLFFGIRSGEGISRFFGLVSLFMISTRLMYLLLLIHPNPILKLDTISSFIIFSPLMWGITAAVLLLYSVIFHFCERKGKYLESFWNAAFCIALGIVVFIILMAAIVLILDARGALPDSIKQFTSRFPYLSWSDNWGNGRGRTWAFSFMMFKEMGFLNKLFGVGPDGYAPYAYALYPERLYEMWGDRTLTNAHNEWMNSVISYGFVGAALYIGIFVSAIKRFAQYVNDIPYLSGFAAVIVTYMCHNSFCYQQVCCTPFLFMIIGMGIYITRQKK